MEQYVRHIDLFGDDNFSKINNASVLVAGAGGLGSTVLSLLARMGIGTIHFYDYSKIDKPDLNRQLLYSHFDVGKTKSSVANEVLSGSNPDINIIAHYEEINEKTNIPNVDLVFDCLDNFTSRYALDDILQKKKIPMIHAGVSRYFGQITLILPEKTKSLRDTITVDAEIFDKKIDKQIFPPAVVAIASLQVSEGIKCLINDFDNALINKILIIDVLTNSYEIIKLK